jgi:hypothetical protein
MLMRRIRARRSASICGRPPTDRDFQRQYLRKPERCQRTRVSGRTTVMALITDGNQRYNWMKNKRSLFVIVDATAHLSLQHNQLTSKNSVLCLKPALRLEWQRK